MKTLHKKKILLGEEEDKLELRDEGREIREEEGESDTRIFPSQG